LGGADECCYGDSIVFGVIGNVASVVAAVTSIALFIYFVWDRRHRVRIRLTPNLVEISAANESHEPMLSVEVVNLGSRPVVLDKVFLYGPEEKLMLLKDSLRDRPEKVLTPENPSISFFTEQKESNLPALIGVVVYDRRGNSFIYHVQSRRKRVARWFRLRLTKEGRSVHQFLSKLHVSGL
jgi:hypothetical protein